ncbi:MAG: SpoIID/LytB domain-containing protein [Bacillota bacterium]|nr:SpoIID/LytB domain-containing protein [Bacillota bacterium]
MKKIIYIISFTAVILLIYLLYPRSLNPSIYVSPYKNGSKLIYNGREMYLKYKFNYDTYSVLNIVYCPLKLYKAEKLSPNKERVMEKGEGSYDMELSGKTLLSGKSFFYKMTADNKLIKSSSKDLLAGYDNVSSYKAKNGKLSLFIIFEKPVSKMRVCLSDSSFTTIYQDNINVSFPEGGEIYSLRDKIKLKIDKGEVLKINKEGSKINLFIKSRVVSFNYRIYLKGSQIKVLSLKRGYPSFNPVYSGVIEINKKDKGLLMINEVDMEDYLKKVVPSEMPGNSSLEALKCQAVAARTYALSDALSSRFGYLGYFVDDSTLSQVYNNYRETENTNIAVEATKGEVMTYNNKPIDAKYYSTSSGIGTNYRDIWFYKDFTSESKPYLKENIYCDFSLPKNEQEWLNFYKSKNISGCDDKSSYYRWEVSLDKASLINSLNITIPKLIKSKPDYIIGKFKTIKDIRDIKITKRGEGGNAKEITLYLNYGSIILRSDGVIRYAFKLGKDYTGSEVFLNKNNSSKSKISSLPSTFFSVEKNEDSFIFYGGGFGHGVGMSQYGAMRLSDEGYLYKDILRFYYKDIEISKTY